MPRVFDCEPWYQSSNVLPTMFNPIVKIVIYAPAEFLNCIAGYPCLTQWSWYMDTPTLYKTGPGVRGME